MPLQVSGALHGSDVADPQGVPDARGVYVQPPMLQVSLVQSLLSLQTVVMPPEQTPPEQRSPVVHALPSLHDAVLFV